MIHNSEDGRVLLHDKAIAKRAAGKASQWKPLLENYHCIATEKAKYLLSMNASADNNASGFTLRRIFPVLAWIPQYRAEWLRADLVAGVTLAAYVIPAAIGDTSLAQLPPQVGLYAALFPALVFWVFCSSRLTIVSVTSAISLLLGTSLGSLSGGDTSRYAALAAATATAVLVPCSRWALRS